MTAVTEQKRKSVSKLADRRAERTREAIDSTFTGLLFRQSYDSIRVSDIIKAAKVGRATFYAHYADKDALLASQIDRIVTPMLRPVPDAPWRVDCTMFFHHITTAPRIFRVLFAGPGSGNAARVAQRGIESYVAAQLAMEPQKAPLGSALTARFISAAMLCIIESWFAGDVRENPETMQAAFERLVGRGLG